MSDEDDNVVAFPVPMGKLAEKVVQILSCDRYILLGFEGEDAFIVSSSSDLAEELGMLEMGKAGLLFEQDDDEEEY